MKAARFTAACAGLLLALTALIMGAGSGALTDPPNDFQVYTNTALSTTSTTVGLTFTRIGDSIAGPTKTLIIKNDGAAATSDIWVNIDSAGTTGAATPTAAGTGDNLAIKAGESFQLDGTFTLLAMRSATGTQAVRVIWSR